MNPARRFADIIFASGTGAGMNHRIAGVHTTTAFGRFDTTSVLRPARLICPDCRRRAASDTALQPHPVGPVDFYHCPACAGTWFYQGKSVDEVLAAAVRHHWPSPIVPKASSSPAALGEPPWVCPCCRGRLVGVLDRQGSGILVQRCLVCYGGWIASTELRKLNDDLLSRVGRKVRKLLSV